MEPVDDWFGITTAVNATGEFVAFVELPNNGLQGEVGNILASIPRLTVINLSLNDLIGNITLGNSNLNNVGIGNTNISSALITEVNPGLTNFANRFSIENTPNLQCIQVPTFTLPTVYNTSKVRFDLGDVYTDDCGAIGALPQSELDALAAFDTVNLTSNGYTYGYLNRGANTTGTGFEFSNIGGVRNSTRILLPQSGLTGDLVPEIGNLTKLTFISLIENSLTSLPESLGTLSQLETLNFSNNDQITSLPQDLSGLISLTTLIFDNCSVTDLPTSANPSIPTTGIGALTTLTRLRFQNNGITLLPEEIGNLINLTSFRPSPNPFPSVPSEYSNLVNLEILDLSGSLITNIPTGFSGLVNLRELYLNNNNLQVIFDGGIGNLAQLEILTLDDNELSTLPNDIGNLGNTLNTITLERNQLTSLPEEIGNLINLTSLNLEINQLESLPDSFGNLTNLVTLNLRNNKLETLPATIGNLTNLLSLDLSNNILTSLPETFGNLSSLSVLQLFNQSPSFMVYTLESLPSSFGDLTNLTRLVAYDVGLTSLPSNFSNLSNLTELRLYGGNDIESDLDISLATSIQILELDRNKFSSLKIGVAPSNLTTYDIKDNPFISCVEVPTPFVTQWQNSPLSTSSTDNGVIYTDACANNNIPQIEREALIAIYQAYRGTTNPAVWTNWSTDATELGNVGSWQGVTTGYINGQKHVTSLSLAEGAPQGGITAAMPAEFGNLIELVEFKGGGANGGPKISSFSETIANLQKLRILDLTNNQLLEFLPPEIGMLTTLNKLDLRNAGQNLTALPEEIGDLPAIRELLINNTKLSQLPTTIGNLQTLEVLQLNSNQLVSLPSTIGNLSSLQSLFLNGQLIGASNEKTLTSLPMEINNLTQLTSLYVTSNAISKTIDANGVEAAQIDLSNLTNLTQLQFNDNELQGLKLGVGPNNFPAGGVFNLTQNPAMSCIEVPAAFVTAWENSAKTIDPGVIYSDDCPINNLPQIERDALIAIYNAMGGEPTQWVNWNPDPTERVNVGAWRGVTTEYIDDVQHVTGLSFESGSFHITLNGDMPSELGNLSELKTLYVFKSFFNTPDFGLMSLPESIGNLQKLEELSVIRNASLGTLPAAIGNLSQLRILRLDDCALTEIPDTLQGLVSLEELNLMTNEFTSLPSSLGSLLLLDRLTITNTNLTTLPTEIGDLDALTFLNASNCNLTSLPDTIGDMEALEVLRVTDNELITLPAGIGNSNNLLQLYIGTNPITSLPLEINNINSLTIFSGNNIELTGVLDFSGLINLGGFYLSSTDVTSIKLGVPRNNFPGGGFNITNNPFLTCLEVPIAFVASYTSLPNGVIVSDACTDYLVPDAERLALIAFYNSTGGGVSWDRPNWNTDPNSMSNVGTWGGVTTEMIDGVKHVVSIIIEGVNTNLPGPIPDNFENLSELRELRIVKGITEIPESFSNLTKLENVSIKSGTIASLPTNFGNLTALTTLDLIGNQITLLPDSFSNLDALITANFRDNELTSLPDTFGNLEALEFLDLTSNNLTTLPDSFGNLSTLINFNAQLNNIETLPDSFTDLIAIQSIALNSNNLSGFLDFSGLSNSITNLILANNQLSGLKLDLSVTEFGNNGSSLTLTGNDPFTCLEVLNDELISWQLEYNNLPAGAVITTNCAAPEEQDRGAVVALYNTTQGSNWTNNTNWLSSEPLSTWFGLSFDTSGRLMSVDLSSNNLVGYIPQQYENLNMLNTFNVSGNLMRDEIPNFQESGANPAIDISDNRYQLADLDEAQANFNFTNFTYIPQDYPQVDRTIFPILGDNVIISVDDTFFQDSQMRSFISPNNVYQWKKDGVDIVGENDSTITILDISPANSGSYTCTITNTVLPDVNIITGATIFNLNDEEAPNLVLQDATLALDGNGNATLTFQDLDAGSSDNAGVNNLMIVISQTMFTCANIGTIQVTVTATDSGNNTDMAMANVNIIDDFAPTLAVSDALLILDTTGNATLQVADVVASATDNCAIASTTLSNSLFTCLDIGVNSVSITVTDTSGNTTEATVNVTVSDTQAPLIDTSPINLSLGTDGTVSINNTLFNVTDNCTVSNISTNILVLDCGTLGDNTVEVTATDSSGNSSTQNVTVTVVDDLAPMVTVQDFTLPLDVMGNATLLITDVLLSASDNCNNLLSDLSQNTFNCNDLGTNNITITTNDNNGNSTSEIVTINVIDNVAPILEVSDTTLTLDNTGNATLQNTMVVISATDACGIIATTLSQTQFNCDDLGTNLITVLVDDASGNSTLMQVSVSVQDTTAPLISTMPEIIELDINGQAIITISTLQNAVTDNCSVDSVSANTTSFDCEDIGQNIIIVTATDTSGNSTNQNLTVDIQDNLAPTIMVQDLTLPLDASNQAFITIVDVLVSAIDNCGIMDSTISENTFDCSNLGANMITVTVNDVNGNNTQETVIVTITDTSNPIANTQDISVVLDSTGTITISADAINDSSADNCSINLAVDIDTFTCEDIGSNIVTLIVTDDSGNMDTAQAIVTVIDNVEPEIICPEDETILVLESEFYTVPDYSTSIVVTDNCTVTAITQSLSVGTMLPIGSVETITITATDQTGNESNCLFILTVNELLGTTDQNINDAISLYPIPSKEIVHIKSGNFTIDVINIFDISGKLIRTIENPTNTIDLSLLSDGVYIAKIKSGNLQSNKRIIKFSK